MSEDRANEFLEMLKFSSTPEKRKQAVKKFKELKDPNLVPHFVNHIYESDDPEMQKTAIQCMEVLEIEHVMKELLNISTSDLNNTVRKAAIRALGNYKNKMAMKSLNKIVNRSDDQEIITAASLAIQVIQGITPSSSQDN